MQKTNGYVLIWAILALNVIGCEKNQSSPSAGRSTHTSVTSTPTSSQASGSTPHQSTVEPVDAFAFPGKQAAYNQALMNAVLAISDRHYSEALSNLEIARKIDDTEIVRQQMDKVRALIAQQATLATTIQDIEAILHQGRAEEASRLAALALIQFGSTADTTRLQVLKREADALLSNQMDQQKRKQQLQAEMELARKDNQLRALLLAYEQWLVLGEDDKIRKDSEEIRTTLAKYDDLRQRALELRKQPEQLEQALALLQDAAKAWDTPQIRDEIANCQIALQSRRDRLSVADFEIRGEVGLPMAGETLADELLPHFKSRFDLVERSQLAKVLAELKFESSGLMSDPTQRSEVGRVAQIRYLVVGSVMPMNGTLTVHARLVEVHSGLIIQTARLSARNAADLVKRMPELAQLLMMSDEEKVAFQQQQMAPPPPVAEAPSELPPVQASVPPPAPIISTTAKPPELGQLRLEDFQRLQPQPEQVVTTSSMTVNLDRPLQQRMFSIQLELGENLFRRGHYQDAVFHFELARELAPSRLDIQARIDACRPHLPPPPVVVVQPSPPVIPGWHRDRIAIMNFLVLGDIRVVPAGLSGWTPEHLAPYFSPPFDVVDQGQLYWYMNRLGLNVFDVMNNPAARRWLAKALRVRYFVFGVVQQTNSFTVTTYMVDAALGYEVGRGSVFVRSQFELKLRLAELARQTLLGPTERLRLQQEAIARETALQEAQIAANQGQWLVAVELFGRLKQKYPFDVQIGFMYQQAEQKAQIIRLEQLRRQEWERQQAFWAAQARRQAELALAAEEARRQAAAQALAEAERQRLLQHRQNASNQLLIQARLALGRGNFTIAIQQFESAAELQPSDDALRELALARARAEEMSRRRLQEDLARRESEWQRQRMREIADQRARFEEERQRRELAERNRLHELQNQHRQVYQRLLDEAQAASAKGAWEAAIQHLQTARQLQRTEEVERLLSQALMEQARAAAQAQNAAKVAELEKRLAEEKARRQAAEELARKNEQLYLGALAAAQKAEQQQQYQIALAKYEEASKLFQTDAVLTGMERNKKALLYQQRQEEEKQQEVIRERKKQTEVSRLRQVAQQAEAQKQFDQALKAFEDALALLPTDVELLAGQSRVRIARDQWLAERRIREKQQDQEKRVMELVQLAQASIAAHQFEAANTYWSEIKKIAPRHQAVTTLGQELERARRAFESDQAKAAATAKAKAEAERLRQKQLEEEERKTQLTALSRYLQQAEQAIQTGQYELAQTFINEAAKLATTDPRVGQVQRQLQQAKLAALQAKAKEEANAKARAEALDKEKRKNYDALMKAGREAMAQSQFDDASKYFKDALKLFPNDPDASMLLGMSEKMDTSEKTEQEKQKREEMEKAKAEADAKAKAEAEARAKRKAEEEAKAREEARIKQQLEERKRQAQMQLRNGKQALTLGQYDEATKAFQEALRLDPTLDEAATLLATARQRNEAKMKAEADSAQNQKEQEAKQAELQKALKAGQDALAAKQYEQAINFFEQVLKLDPKHTEAKFKLNLARQMLIESKKQQDQNKSDTATKDDAAKKQAEFMALMRAGAQAYAAKRYEEAVKHYTAAQAMNPRDPLANRALNDSRKALEESKRSTPTPTQPSRPSSGSNIASQAEYTKQMQLGQQHDRQKKWAEAANAYRAALKAIPNDAPARGALNLAEFNMYMEIGQNHLKNKKNAEAADAFEEALKRIPNQPEAVRLLKQAKQK